MVQKSKVSVSWLVPLLPVIFCAAVLLMSFREPTVIYGTVISRTNEQVMSLSLDRRQQQRLHGSIDVNTANEELLCTVPGIGPVTSQRIIAERELNGPFYYAEDLLTVKGIGEKTLKKLEDYLYISDSSEDE